MGEEDGTWRNYHNDMRYDQTLWMRELYNYLKRIRTNDNVCRLLHAYTLRQVINLLLVRTTTVSGVYCCMHRNMKFKIDNAKRQRTVQSNEHK